VGRKCYKGVGRVLQWSEEGVPEVGYGCYKGLTRVRQCCKKGATM
jgi:hypothetical protein